MAKDTRFSRNIRSLRKAYGLTQEELGAMFHLEKTTIANYEAGTREPDREKASKIAQYFMVSVEELFLCDLSDVGTITVDNTSFWKKIDILLPIITSERAEENEHFKKALKYHMDFYDKLHAMNLDGFDNMDVCVEAYMEACEDKSIEAEASGNLLAIWYLILTMFKTTPLVMKNRPAPLMQITEKDLKAREIIDNPDSTFIADAEELEKEIYDLETRELLDELRRTLKYSRWMSLADYYIALQYVWGFVENDLDWDTNRCIGTEMLKSFAIVGNVYAARYFKYSLDSMGLSSQSVNDKE